MAGAALGFELCSERFPVKASAGVMLAAGGNVFVASDIGNGVVIANGLAQPLQRQILRRFEVQALQAFEFYADGVIIAAVAPAPVADACMPGSVVTAHKLPDLALARNEEVRGNFQPANALIVGLVNSCCTAPVPYWPGGRLME